MKQNSNNKRERKKINGKNQPEQSPVKTTTLSYLLTMVTGIIIR